VNEILFPDYRIEYSKLFEQFRIWTTQNDNLYYWFTPLSRIDSSNGPDITRSIPQVEIDEMDDSHVCAHLGFDSSIWKEKTAHFIFSPEGIEHYVTVKGQSRLGRMYYFMGLLDNVVRGSVPGFDYFTPACPNFLGRQDLGPNEYFSNSVTNETTHWGLALNSGPLFYSFHKKGSDHCIWVGLVAEKGQNHFDRFDFNYKPEEVENTHDNIINTQSFSLDYAHHLTVDGLWESPHIHIGCAANAEIALKQYCELLERKGAIPTSEQKIHSWWRKPIFCGWHEQVAVAHRQQDDSEASMLELEGADSIFNQCTQEKHQHWLDIIHEQDLPIGTIIIDAKWQKEFGGFEVDETKWPDLRGFIEDCHRRDQHVILWIMAWDMEGLASNECIQRNEQPISPDPTSPAYRERLEKGIHFMLSQDGLNADGLKVDGTNRIPVGPDIKTHQNKYGYELQYEYLKIVYESARCAKSDALVSLFTANPYYRDVCNIVRLGDLYSLYGRPVDTLNQRAQVVKIAMAGKLIDTDGNFQFSLATDFVPELEEQARLGIPTIYQAEYVFQHRTFSKPVCRKLTQHDYQRIRQILLTYSENL
jgi:hypothetical protein